MNKDLQVFVTVWLYIPKEKTCMYHYYLMYFEEKCFTPIIYIFVYAYYV